MFEKRIDSVETAKDHLKLVFEGRDEPISAYSDVAVFKLDERMKGSQRVIWPHREILATRANGLYLPAEHRGHAAVVPHKDAWWYESRYYAEGEINEQSDPLAYVAARAVYEVANDINRGRHREKIDALEEATARRVRQVMTAKVKDAILVEDGVMAFMEHSRKNPNSMESMNTFVRNFIHRQSDKNNYLNSHI